MSFFVLYFFSFYYQAVKGKKVAGNLIVGDSDYVRESCFLQNLMQK